MTAFLIDLLAQIWPYVVVVIAFFGWGMAKRREGRKEERAAADARAAREQAATVERVLNETPSADPVDDIRRRMRERAGKP
jgi:hypothetical protein